MEPKSPILGAHRALTEPRFLSHDELGGFSVLASEEASGSVGGDGYRGESRPILRGVSSALDPRLERVNRQQYLKVAVLRRDVTYEMAGTSGTIVLSGNALDGARTPQALRPIKRRLVLWAALMAAVGVTTFTVLIVLIGHAPYFARSNKLLTLLWMLSLVLTAVALAGVLRALRPGLRLGSLRALEKISATGAVCALLLLPVGAVLARPRVTEVGQALSRGDVAQARLAADALKELKGATSEVNEADDAVMLAEAALLSGDARVRVLDAVAARRGTRADEAAAAARAHRIGEIRKLVDAKAGDQTITAIDTWFPNWKADSEIAEQRARAYETTARSCASEACAYRALKLASDAAGTPARVQASSQARSKLLNALATGSAPGEDALARVKRMHAVADISAASLVNVRDDDEVVRQAKKAASWAAAELEKVALIGAQKPLIEELFGAVATHDGSALWIGAEQNRVYLVLDAAEKCRGIYIVGGAPGAREISGSRWTAERLLSQALGHTATVRKPIPDGATISRASDRGIPIVTRWNSGQLIEIRVGDAAP